MEYIEKLSRFFWRFKNAVLASEAELPIEVEVTIGACLDEGGGVQMSAELSPEKGSGHGRLRLLCAGAVMVKLLMEGEVGYVKEGR